MTRDDIIALAQEAVLKYPNENPFDFRLCRIETVERFAALVAAEKEQQMIRDGYRQCAKGQRTTQFCGLLDAAVKAEREKVAAWMRSKSYATGHGDTIEDLLKELEWQVAEESAELLQALQNLHQRCHWADAPEEMDAAKAAIDKAIRARGNHES